MVKNLIISLLFIVLFGCSSLQLTPTDFAWPIETVLTVDEQGFIKDDRYSIKVNVQNLYVEEFGGLNLSNKNLRMIRNSSGIYFITAEGFKNVYLFKQDIGALTLLKKIKVSENGLKNPFFNQRDSYVELKDENINVKLSNEGIIGDKK
ncbi:MAG: hypothetical protein NZM09_10705 [Ignavibacterium sp.]|nr:hypothetical protein [Ignavibacterium sp.]MDW8376147.1 hypothetical protein [Ignavibacteriales bacterium]